MTWFKVDDSFAQHPKVLSIPRRDRAACIGLWTLAGTWCASQLTDGRLARGLLGEFACTTRQAQLLVESGLWATTDEGYAFHDWESWQPTKAQVEAERAAAKERMQKVRGSRGVRPNIAEPTANFGRSSGEVRLTPSRPVPSSKEEEKNTPLRVVPPVSEMNAGQVLGMWLETLNRRPAGSVIGQLGKHVKALLEDKFSQQEILDGLNAMQAKGLNPSVLPSLVSSSAVRSKSKPMRNPEEMHSPATRFSG